MASLVDVAPAFDDVPQRKERLRKCFGELESKQSLLVKQVGASWKDIDEHFKDVEKSLRKMLEEYTAKEKALEANVKKVEAELSERDANIASKEQASLARVQVEKDAAVATILEQKRKWSEDKRKLGASVQAEKPLCKLIDDYKQSEAMELRGNTAFESALNGLLAEVPKGSSAFNAQEKIKKQHVLAEPRSELKPFFQNMDSGGLRKYIVNHKKYLKELIDELPSAFKWSSDPYRLVLKALDDYYSSDQGDRKKKKSDESIANRRACAILLEALAHAVADPDSGIDHPSSDSKTSAKEFANRWKSKLDLEGTMNFVKALEAQSFLQLLVTFGLKSECSQDELCNIVTKIARRKQTPELFCALGLTEKAADVVESLIKDNKKLEAISFASEFDLFERFPPVPMLKAHLQEEKQAAKALRKSGNMSQGAEKEANEKELAALKAVVNAIKEFKLESQYSPASLETRITQLEKSKEDRKRAATTTVTQNQMKKQRSYDSLPSGPAGKGQGDWQAGVHDRSRYGGMAVPPFSSAPRSAYDRSLGGQDSVYGNRVESAGSYLHTADGPSSLGYRSAAYGKPVNTYSGYNYTSSLSSVPSAYPPHW